MHIRKTTTVVIFLAMIATIIALFLINRSYQYTIGSSPKFTQQLNEQPDDQKKPSSPPDTLYVIPNTLYLPVPFTSQAPDGNWVLPFKEACEEASSLMAGEYFSGNQEEKLGANYAKGEILKLVEWEQARFGYHLDLNTNETAQVLEQYYGLRTKILADFTEDDLKRELSQDRLILLPADGRKLNNPNFRQPGPPYHMLVVKGYDEKNFITNDPGTRNGMDYPYMFPALYAANGNWSHESEAVDLSDKMIIVTWK